MEKTEKILVMLMPLVIFVVVIKCIFGLIGIFLMKYLDWFFQTYLGSIASWLLLPIIILLIIYALVKSKDFFRSIKKIATNINTTANVADLESIVNFQKSLIALADINLNRADDRIGKSLSEDEYEMIKPIVDSIKSRKKDY